MSSYNDESFALRIQNDAQQHNNDTMWRASHIILQLLKELDEFKARDARIITELHKHPDFIRVGLGWGQYEKNEKLIAMVVRDVNLVAEKKAAEAKKDK